jgi:hypothetical protein
MFSAASPVADAASVGVLRRSDAGSIGHGSAGGALKKRCPEWE